MGKHHRLSLHEARRRGSPEGLAALFRGAEDFAREKLQERVPPSRLSTKSCGAVVIRTEIRGPGLSLPSRFSRGGDAGV